MMILVALCRIVVTREGELLLIRKTSGFVLIQSTLLGSAAGAISLAATTSFSACS